MPTHTHFVTASGNAGDTVLPTDGVLGEIAGQYGPPSGLTTFAPSVTNVGGNQPHENMQPYLTLSFCIALIGIFPAQN